MDRLTPQQVKDMILLCGDHANKALNLDIVSIFCNFVSADKIPNNISKIFFGARLISLKKKDGGYRPIAIGNRLRRLCSKLVCKVIRDDAIALLYPHQVGFGISKGIEAAIHSTRRFLQNDKNKVRFQKRL